MPKVGEKLGRLIVQLQEKCDFDPSKYGSGGGPFDFSGQATLLQISLETAVPLWALELKELERGLSPEQFGEHCIHRAKECADYIAENGDALMFRTKGKSAEAFNRLAEGIAIMSFCPGGVKVFGSHWRWGTTRVKV